jgi:threonine/homoserine/homoserine lactone efflux protein
MRRMGRLISKFLSHVLPGVIRPLHALWNEVIGFLFIIFAVVAGFYVIRGVRAFDGTLDGLFRIVLAGLFGVLMAYFGVSSFLKARKISRS